MKISLSKLMAIAIWLPGLILLGISGYNLYTQFNEYKSQQRGVKYLELGDKLENLLVYLGQERGISSIYSVSKGNTLNQKSLFNKKEHNLIKV
jgi:two-component system sensor histidine kinase BarA